MMQVHLIKEITTSKFDASVDLSYPSWVWILRKSNQMVRGLCPYRMVQEKM